jgi:uncharacterized membrane protein (DUF485 family)
MHHGPAVKMGKDAAFAIKQRIGGILFLLYFAIYAGFVAINTLSPVTMETIVIFGLNLAVVYGFGLIILAIVSGLLYNRFCNKAEARLNNDEGENK